MNPILWISVLSAVLIVLQLYLSKTRMHSIGIIHSIVWLGVSVAYAIWQADLEVVTENTLWVMVVGIFMFSLGTLLGLRMESSIAKSLCPEGLFNSSYLVPYVIVIVSLMGLGAMVYQALELLPLNTSNSLMGDDSWYARLRPTLVSEKKGSYGLASYVLNFSLVGTAYLAYLCRFGRESKLLWPSVFITLGLCFLTTGRTYLVLFGCLIFVANAPIRRRNQLGMLVSAFIGILVVTWIAGRINQAPTDELLASWQNHAKLYFVAPVAALNYLVDSGQPQTWGANTFRTMFAIMKAVGIEVNVPELVQPYPPVKLSANVYTVFSPYYRDFGFWGVAFFMALLGITHGWVAKQLDHKSFLLTVISGILLYALLMQFFQDQYFSLLSQWGQMIIWAFVFSLFREHPDVEATS